MKECIQYRATEGADRAVNRWRQVGGRRREELGMDGEGSLAGCGEADLTPQRPGPLANGRTLEY